MPKLIREYLSENRLKLINGIGSSHTTSRHYLDILSGTFMVRELTPWFENVGKRQVKTPKVYFRDTGILHALLSYLFRGSQNWRNVMKQEKTSFLIVKYLRKWLADTKAQNASNSPIFCDPLNKYLLSIHDYKELKEHPKLGPSWEGFALEVILRFHEVPVEEAYFWAVHGAAELDLLLFLGGKKVGFEIKYAEAPKLTQSMQVALEVLKLDKLVVIVPEGEDFPLAKNVRVQSLENYLQT